MKNIDYVIKKTALDTGLPEGKVRIVITEYWETIYNLILQGKGTTITARHLGTFTVSRWKLYNYMRKIIKKIRNILKLDKLSEEKKKAMLDTEYKKLKNCLYHRNVVAKDYAKQFKNV